MMNIDRAIVITGPVGAGKSTTAVALSGLLEASGVPHAMIDVDYLRWAYPAPEDDRFHAALGIRNTAAVAANYREAGVRVIILADVVERPEQRTEYEVAIPNATVTIVRLPVSMTLIAERLRGRESPASLEWYLHRAPELEAIMTERGIGDVVIDVGDRSPEEVAREIAVALEFLPETVSATT